MHCVCGLQPEEKSKFDGIFDSLVPVNGLLSGEKVKPVLMNSKLPVDVLGKVNSLFNTVKLQNLFYLLSI